MKKSKIITLSGQEITVKELTVGEIADCMDAVSSGSVDVVDLLMDGKLPSEAVLRSSGLKRKDLKAFAPSALEELWEAATECNPFFARMLAAPAGHPAPVKRSETV